MGNPLTVIPSPHITAVFYLLPDPRQLPVITLATLAGAGPVEIAYEGAADDRDALRYRVAVNVGFGAVSPFAIRATS